MEFLQNNWVWIIFVGLFVWMMASGSGCCSSGKHGRGKQEETHQH